MSFRIERRGPVEPLTPRFIRFLGASLRGVSLDEQQYNDQKRPDFVCFGGLLVVEIKTLAEDGSERMNNFFAKLRKQSDWPLFVGAWPISSIIKNMDDPKSIEMKAKDRIGRAIVDHLNKANKQLREHTKRHQRLNQLRLVVLINEDHEIYHPSVAIPVIQRVLFRNEASTSVCDSIDAVFFLSERHAVQRADTGIAYPVIAVTAPTMDNHRWKQDLLKFITEKWSMWLGLTFENLNNEVTGALLDTFSTIEHVPNSLPMHEVWRLEYRRNPYMRFWTDDDLRLHWDNLSVVRDLACVKGSPVKPSDAEIARCRERFTHLLDEIARRGLPLGTFKPDPGRMVAAAIRVGVPPAAVRWIAWFSSLHGSGGPLDTPD